MLRSIHSIPPSYQLYMSSIKTATVQCQCRGGKSAKTAHETSSYTSLNSDIQVHNEQQQHKSVDHSLYKKETYWSSKQKFLSAGVLFPMLSQPIQPILGFLHLLNPIVTPDRTHLLFQLGGKVSIYNIGNRKQSPFFSLFFTTPGLYN